MIGSSLKNEYQRRQRIRHPKDRDHCAYLLLGIMGGDWWISSGFIREYPEDRCLIDLANPELRIAIEGDGRAYHSEPMDVLHDERRDQFLRSRGWYVMRFTYEQLQRPERVRAKILSTMANFGAETPEHAKITKRQMKRSGIYL